MNLRVPLLTTAAVGTGLAGGVFFAFSTFVMSALRKLPPVEGISAMQSINRQAPTAAFMTLLFGTAAVCTGAGVHAALNRDQPGALWAGIGATSYLVAIVLTAAYHVPRNDRLVGFDASSAEALRYWSTYVTEWTTANHVRTFACTVAAVAFTRASQL
jgi:uncharacterized membrane protein